MGIEAKPNEYAGVVFRSKLEATWARFFDLIGVEWEYEPSRLPGWIPDFLIDGWWLAEVKPLNAIGVGVAHDPVFQKAIRRFDTVILGDGPGDALGLVVRRMDDGGVFKRYLMADTENGPAQLHVFPHIPQGFRSPLVAIWRGIVDSSDSWQAAPFRSVALAAHEQIFSPEAEQQRKAAQ